jgi:hypothetical protein
MDVIIEAYIGLLHVAVPNFEEKVVRDMVRNFTGSIRPDNDDEETIYDELALAYPIFGDPRSYYEETYIPYSDTARIAAGSAKRARTQATDLSRRADVEYNNKLRCVQFELQTRLEQSQTQPITTSVAPLGMLSRLSAGLLISPGEYVLVQADLSEGHHSHGGKGWVKAVDGTGALLTVTVGYHESESGCQHRSESGIPISRLTICSGPFNKLPKRRTVNLQHNQPKNSSIEVPQLPNASQMPLRDALMDGFSRNRKKGWRAKDLGVEDSLKLDFDGRFLLDVKELDGVISTLGNGCKHSQRKGVECLRKERPCSNL